MRTQVLSALAAAGIALAPLATSAHTIAPDAMTGSKAWAVVLCQFQDTIGQQPHPVQWYQDFVTRSAPGHDGLWDYWHDVSYGKMDLNGTEVITSNGGWNSLPHTVEYYAGLSPQSARYTLWHDCAQTAGSVDYSKYYGVLAMLNAQRDSGAVSTGQLPTTLNGKQGSWGAVVLDPAGAQDVSWGAHEMGHAFGLNHSYDTALQNCTSSKTPGEYCDPYDQMGYENSGNTIETSDYGNGAPGMVAPNLDKLGFVTPTIIDPSKGSEDVPLGRIETSPEVIQVPAGDSPQHYYTVELVDPAAAYASGTAWGQNLQGGMIIHEARTNGLFYLVDTQGGPAFQLCQSFTGVNNIRILYLQTPSSPGSDAYVRIGTTNDGVPDPGYCTAGAPGSVVQPVGGGGSGIGNGCSDNMFGICVPKPMSCNFAPHPGCQPNVGRMQ